MKKQYNFECKLECKGKCCSYLTYIEKEHVNMLQDKAIISLEIRFYLNSYIKSNKKYKYFYKNLKESLFPIKIENFETIYFLTDIQIGIKDAEEKLFCPFLKDGLCSLEFINKKPLKCKLLPYQPLVPLESMNYAFEAMTSFCVGFDSNKFLWTKKSYNPYYKKLYFQYHNKLKDLKKVSEILFEYNIIHQILYKVLEELLHNDSTDSIDLNHINVNIPIFNIPELTDYFKIKDYKKFQKNQLELIDSLLKNECCKNSKDLKSFKEGYLLQENFIK